MSQTTASKREARALLLEQSRLMSCPEVDRVYRLRSGTCLSAAQAGLIRAAKRSMRGRTTYLIEPADARQMWGPR